MQVRRFGKSRLGVQLCIEQALDGGRVWWVAPTFSIARVGWRDVVAAASIISLKNLELMSKSAI